MLELSKYIVRQKIEPLEIFGYETRNKYEILDERGTPALYVAEQGKSLLGFLARQFLGHGQKLNLFIYNMQREKVLEIHHPFKFFFQRIDLRGAQGEVLGSCVHRFGIFRRRLDVLDTNGNVILQMRTPITWFMAWTYPFYRNDRPVAKIEKKFSGLLRELFTDADNFLVSFDDPNLNTHERSLVIAAAILIDLLFFEEKAGRQ